MADAETDNRPDPGALPPAPASGTPSSTLGELLRQARLERGLTIQQIAATTRIPARHLDALERNDLGAVPGGMYLRAEIRAFADTVGLSRSVALGCLTSPADDAAVTANEVRATSSRGAWRGPILLAATCLLAALVVWAVAWRPDRNATATASVAEPQPVTAPQSLPSPVRTSGSAPTSHDPQAASSADTNPLTATSGFRETSPGILPVGDAATGAAPPAPADLAAELEIVTEPAGAHVTINGLGWGVTPVTIKYLPPGTKRLRVTRNGFASAERVIQFEGTRPRTRVEIALTPID